MPGIHADAASPQLPELPEETTILLPSSLPSDARSKSCDPHLLELEDRLRYAQAMEALSGLRRQLRTRVMARNLINKNASSQRTFLRSRSLQDQVERHIKQFQRQYNTARSALLSLRGPGEWETKLQVLKPEDV